tara:strand:+ start:1043 stop:1390 length:348 start_codon:yes stop_codon:yes gene_type:complete
MKIKRPNLEKCLHCGREMVAYNNVGKKYCNTKCRSEYRKMSGYFIIKYKRKAKQHLKKCEMCGRKILSVGERKSASKFCGKKCAYLSYKKRNNNQKFITIKIPIGSYNELFRRKN